MNRRTFILLTGAASTALLRPPRAAARWGGRSVGRLRFELDDRRRWSLWYLGEEQPVPLFQTVTLGARIADRLVTLADLEYSTVGNRRPPGGESVIVRGHAAGVVLEAELFATTAAATPQAAIGVSVYPDRELPSVRGVRFFDVPADDVMPGGAPLLALVNGYDSRSGSRIVALPLHPDGPELVSYGALGLTRAARGLGLGFEAGGPGEGKVRISKEGLEATSEWAPGRPLRPEGDTSWLKLCYQPSGDGLDALRALFVPASPVDRERLATVPAPAGWCSWHELRGGVTETDVIANAEFCAGRFDRRFLRYIQLDDGYQRSAGDWVTNDKFPHGHRWLTDQIHGRGFQAGLWLAPFAVTERSGIPAAHPDWLLKGADGNAPIVWDAREDWGGRAYALDGAHPAARQWLFDLARRAVQEWGYDYLKLDFLFWATGDSSHYGGLTHAEAYRMGLGALRDGAGTETFLLGCGAPLQHATGLVNGMRVGPDVDASWSGIQTPARVAALRSFYHRGAWLNDPDCLVVRAPLSPSEAELWASIVAVSGEMTMLSDNLPKLPPERLPLLQRALPVAAAVGRPIGAVSAEPDVAPALVAGDESYRMRGPWRFRTGDDPAYAARNYDETAWETLPVPESWERAGHPGYEGYAWYRTRFSLPGTPPGRSAGQADGRTARLELGKIDDVDETFVNGVKVGQTGAFPPRHRGEREAFRRYAVPHDALNWGGENILAVRTYGGGGLWSTRRDRPANIWLAEGAPAWWTVVLANWEDEPGLVAAPLVKLGISGKRFNAYDVWRDTPLADLTDMVSAKLDPHASLTIAIRPAATRPQVIGTTRHVVQGAVDVASETWNTATRTLQGRSTNLDSRPYAVTIAAPKGMRPATCKASAPCTVTRLESGHAVLTWAGGEGKDIEWELRFRQSATARKGKN